MTPHHALRHSGGSARVQHVDVISSAAREITIGRRCSQCCFVFCANHDDIAKVRQSVTNIVDGAQILGLGYDRNTIGIVIEITKLSSYVAIVDVDRDSTDLGARVKGLYPFVRVLRMYTHMLTTLDANRQKVIRQASDAFIKFGKSELDIVSDQCGFVRNRIGNDFKKVTELD